MIPVRPALRAAVHTASRKTVCQTTKPFCMENEKEKVNVFVSYSTKDRPYFQEFFRHLTILQRSGSINEIYSPETMVPLDESIENILEKSSIIVFLLTPEALASAFIDNEIKLALDKYENGKALILPVLIKRIDQSATPLGKFQISQFKETPLAELKERDEAWVSVIQDLRTLIHKITLSAAHKLIEEARFNNSEFLDLGNCGLTGIPQELFDLKNLTGLILGCQQVESLASFDQLKFVTEPKATEFKSLWAHPWFTRNEGPANDLSHADLARLTALKNLRFLNLDGCNADVLRFDFSLFESLRILLAGNNQEVKRFGYSTAAGSDAEPLRFYSRRCSHLKVLSLSRSNLQDLPPGFFDAISSVEYLNLSLNPLLDSFITHLNQCPKLVSLDLESNNLKDPPLARKYLPTDGNSVFENLPKLRWLNLSRSNLDHSLPVHRLSSLEFLYANHAAIDDARLFANLVNLKILQLRENKLISIASIVDLPQLKALDVSNNQLADLGGPWNLSWLEELDLSGNTLKSLAALKGLRHLKTLDAAKNELTDTSPLLSCKALQSIDLSQNKITDATEIQRLLELPKLKELKIDENPLKDVDQMRLRQLQHVDDYRNFFKGLDGKERVANNEVKLILVGNGTAGKSTLRRMIQNRRFEDNEGTTHGIVRDEWKIEVNGNPLKVYIWDFGGQEYYHETHKLFFSKNAVYVLVWEQATNKNQIDETWVNVKTEEGIETKKEYIEHYSCEYWLQSIQHYAPRSPVIVVQNKIDQYLVAQSGPSAGAPAQGRVKRLPDKLLDACPNITDTFDLSLKKVEEEEDDFVYDYRKFLHILKKRLSATATSFGIEASFCKIKEEILRKSKTESKWEKTRFDAYCRLVDPAIDLDKLLDYLCNISIVLYFRERESLKDTVIINPVWVSEQIYNVLNQSVLQNGGRFQKEHVAGLLGSQADAFIELMTQFGIVFKPKPRPGNAGNEYIAPQYLPESNVSRYYTLMKSQLSQPRFVLEFPAFLPKTIMNNILSVYADKAIDGTAYHKYGVAFDTATDELNILEYDFKSSRITFYSKTNDPVNTRSVFETVLSLFGNINISDANQTYVDKRTEEILKSRDMQVLLSVDGETFINWNTLFLQRAQMEGKALLPERGKETHTSDFVAFYLSNEELKKKAAEPKKAEPVKVFISYAHKDEAYKDELLEHLSGLRRQRFIQSWTDRAILAGDKWDDVIKKNLHEAQVVIFLVSPSFMASDYIQDYEIKLALERSNKSGSGVCIVPVPVRTCDVENSPLKEFQGAIRDFKPVSSWPNKDDAWMDVINKLKALIQEKFGVL